MPVYCYDYFGGPGYLSDSNIERAAHFNFAGRCGRRRLSAEAIADELVRGYGVAVAWVRGVDPERFRLERAVDRVLAASASANREKAAALGRVNDDLERERRMSRAFRTAFVVQMLYRRQSLEAQAALAENQAALCASRVALERVESELHRTGEQLVQLAQRQEQFERELVRQRRDLEGVKAQAARTLKLLGNRVMKPTVAVRKLLRALARRLLAGSRDAPSSDDDPGP
jgi:hypothetical protein